MRMISIYILIFSAAALQGLGASSDLPLTNGGNHAGYISADGQVDTWILTANTADNIVLRMGSPSIYPEFTAYAPGGAQIGNTFDESGLRDAYLNIIATNAGLYTVLVQSHYQGGQGGYNLHLAQIPGEFQVPPNDEGGAMTNGATHSGYISLGDLDLWTFTANSGDSVVLRMGSANIYPEFTVYAPGGTQIAGKAYDESGSRDAYLNITATNAGVYTVLVQSHFQGGQGGYNLQLVQLPGELKVPSNDEGGAMTNGATHSGYIFPGDLDPWTFTARAGDTILLRMNTADVYPLFTVYEPGGAPIGGAMDQSGSRDAFLNITATNAGLYTVLVQSYYQGGQGSYELHYTRLPPELILPETVTIDEGATLNVSISAQDPETPSKPLAFTLLSSPSTATFTSGQTNASISWPTGEAEGPSTNVIVASVTDTVDGVAYTRTNQFTVIVREVNSAPFLAPIANIESRDDTIIHFTAKATDPDQPANTITYSLGPNSPAEARIDPITGEFTWPTGRLIALQTRTVTVRTTDNGTPPLFAETSVTIIISPNVFRLAPLPDRELEELGLLTFTATVADSPQAVPPYKFTFDGDAPEGAILSPVGVFFWRPTEAQGPSTNRIAIHVTDSALPPNSYTQTFLVLVREVNQSPVLEPIPNQSLKVGDPLSILVHASDPDLPANNLTLSLDPGSPAGMTIAANGLIQWIVPASFAGTTNHVTIRVADNGLPSLSATQTLTVQVSAGAPLRLSARRSVEGKVTVKLSGEIGRTYFVEATSDLKTWTLLTTFISENPDTDIPDPEAPNSIHRFYRAISP